MLLQETRIMPSAWNVVLSPSFVCFSFVFSQRLVHWCTSPASIQLIEISSMFVSQSIHSQRTHTVADETLDSMPMKTDRDSSDGDEPLSDKEEYAEKREAFMRRHLRNHWPKRIVLLIGIAQCLISMGILGIDFPIIFMYAPRWETFAGCWTFVLGFVASVSTMHSCKRTRTTLASIV